MKYRIIILVIIIISLRQIVSLYIFLKSFRNVTVFVCSSVRVGCLLLSLHSVRFGQLLRCAHKRIVNIMKVYIERNNIQVELIQFRKNSDFIAVGSFEVGNLSRPTCLWNWAHCYPWRVATVRCWAVAVDLGSKGVGSWFKGFRLFAFPADTGRRQLCNSTVSRYRWIPRAG